MPQWYEKEIGPLPAGVWVGVIAVGAGVSYFVNRNKKAAAATAPADTSATVPATDGAFGSIPAGVNLGGIVGLPGGIPSGELPSNPVGSTGQITDNNSWLRNAEDQLIAKGYDPGLVDTALRSYLQGNVPSAAQQAIVNLALQLLGAPPFPVTTIPSNPGTGGTGTGGQGPLWPATAPGAVPAGTSCPPGYVLAYNATMYTCVTADQWNTLLKYLGSVGAK